MDAHLGWVLIYFRIRPRDRKTVGRLYGSAISMLESAILSAIAGTVALPVIVCLPREISLSGLHGSGISRAIGGYVG